MAGPGNGKFKIISLTEGNHAAGIQIDACGIPVQTICLGASVQDWYLYNYGGRVYEFHIGQNRFTGLVSNKVYAIDFVGNSSLWRVTYREAQDAYTIEPHKLRVRGKGWTVPEGPGKKEIVIKTIEEFEPLEDEEPQFSASQLFRFERVEDDEWARAI